MKSNQTKEEKQKKNLLSTFGLGALFGGAIVYVLGRIFDPLLSEVGDRIMSFVFEEESEIYISACAPLRSSYKIYRAFDPISGEDILVEQVEEDNVNNTVINVFNHTGKDISDVRITVVPFSDHNQQTNFASTRMYSNAIDSTGNIKVLVDEKNGSRKILVDRLSDRDGIVIEDILFGAVNFHVELTSKEKTERKYFPKGCDGEIKLAVFEPQYVFFENVAEHCKRVDGELDSKFSCSLEEERLSSELSNLIVSGSGLEIKRYVNDELASVSVQDPSRVPFSPLLDNQLRMEFKTK